MASNRLPVIAARDAAGNWSVRAGSGGLVTALVPVLEELGGTWIGWPGSVDAPAADMRESLEQLCAPAPYRLQPVSLSAGEVESFYEGFANGTVWPLFHELSGECRFEPAHWRGYQQVNRKYAEQVLAACHGDELVWVHDYHLMNVAAHLRTMGLRNRLAFFLHIPFPNPSVFMRLPWRRDVLRALLAFDLLGFQTAGDRDHFIQCLRRLYRVHVTDAGQVQQLEVHTDAETAPRRVSVGSFPVSIDARAFAARAASDSAAAGAARLAEMSRGRRIILSLDRLDYTKGIPAKLAAFREALRRSPDLIDQAVLYLYVIPSREHVPQYRQLRLEIEQRVSEINGRFSRPGRVPIHYFYQSLSSDELAAHYRAADIALVTPLRDGMNLVAKEYCCCQTGRDGVLVLSEFAGTAAELGEHALLVNPYDTEGLASTILEALAMEKPARQRRMEALQGIIHRNDIYRWVADYLRALDEGRQNAPATARRPAAASGDGFGSRLATEPAGRGGSPSLFRF